jgi:hypothetical protein
VESPANIEAPGSYFEAQAVATGTYPVLVVPEGAGMKLPTGGAIFSPTEYSIRLVVKFDSVTGLRRVIDFNDGESCEKRKGLFISGQRLVFLPNDENNENAGEIIERDT